MRQRVTVNAVPVQFEDPPASIEHTPNSGLFRTICPCMKICMRQVSSVTAVRFRTVCNGGALSPKALTHVFCGRENWFGRIGRPRRGSAHASAAPGRGTGRAPAGSGGACV